LKVISAARAKWQASEVLISQEGSVRVREGVLVEVHD